MVGISSVSSTVSEKDQVKRAQTSASSPTSESDNAPEWLAPGSTAGRLSAAKVLQLQRTIGNRAVQRLIARQSAAAIQRDDDDQASTDSSSTSASAGSSMPDVGASGQPAAMDDETMQLAFGSGGTADIQRAENSSEEPTPVSGTAPTFIRPQTVRPMRYLPDGAFELGINWRTDGHSGYILQQIYNQQSITRVSDGQHNDADQTYYEAWSILPDSSANPAIAGENDTFDRPTMTSIFHTATLGNWLKRGTIYWAANLDPAAGFRPYGVRNAGLLMATMTRPANLGSAIDTRTYTGRWNSSDPNNQTHTPG